MSIQIIRQTVQFKLYPNGEQAATLTSWLAKCCWIHNRALDHRQKSWLRREEPISLYDQQLLLTAWRSRMEWIRELPMKFARGAMRRVDDSMKAFFRRVKAGEKPGYPRFKSRERFRSMEYPAELRQLMRKNAIFVPGIGPVRARGRFGVQGKQKLLRITRRASGWHASVVVESLISVEPKMGLEVGIDLGIESFLTTDAGEKVGNPRHLREAAKKLRRVQQKLDRCQPASNRRKAAKSAVALIHERVVNRRRGFHHRTARDLVNRFARIALEDLNVKGLAAGMLAKSVNDVGWGQFVRILQSKAENAGVEVVLVNPAGTSQECPGCGAIVKKALSEREHVCPCGFRCHRGHASALVIRQRAFRLVRGEPVRPLDPDESAAGSWNRADLA